MASDTILVLDEGTTSTRAMLFGADGSCRGSEQRELKQHYPRPGWVEHDAAEIWAATLGCARAMVEKAGGADRIAGIGITNQRETIVFWSRRTGEPLAPAIVWQDRRTAADCARLKEAGHEPALHAKTGLVLDPHGIEWTPIMIETAEGKREYAELQRRYAERAAPIARLILAKLFNVQLKQKVVTGSSHTR